MEEVKKRKRVPLAQRLAQLALERRSVTAETDPAPEPDGLSEALGPAEPGFEDEILVAEESAALATDESDAAIESSESAQAAAASVVAAFGTATAEADEAERARRELEASLDAAEAEWDEAHRVAEQSAIEAESELGLAEFRVSLNENAAAETAEPEPVGEEVADASQETPVAGYDESIDGVISLIEEEIERLKAALETYRLLNHPQKGDIIRWHVRRLDERQDQLEELERMMRAGEPLH